ncbi:MAG: helix-turn-helix domain-containing protein [Deferribacteraceae bacterium]|jgi:excisionase family DNA binding protein|nr:helix-turn-helix domain-containing protein [Deferribacteraceae bacterium]
MYEKKLMRFDEVAAVFGIKPKSLYNWTNTGILPKVKIGGKVFIPTEAVKKLIEEKIREAGREI